MWYDYAERCFVRNKYHTVWDPLKAYYVTYRYINVTYDLNQLQILWTFWTHYLKGQPLRFNFRWKVLWFCTIIVQQLSRNSLPFSRYLYRQLAQLCKTGLAWMTEKQCSQKYIWQWMFKCNTKCDNLLSIMSIQWWLISDYNFLSNCPSFIHGIVIY